MNEPYKNVILLQRLDLLKIVAYIAMADSANDREVIIINCRQ